MGAGRARRDDGVVEPLDAERDRELAARRVDEHVGQEVRRHAVGTALAPDLVLLEDAVDTADRRPEDDADTSGIEPVQPGVTHRFARRAEGEQDVPFQLAYVLRRSDLSRVEVLDLGGDANREPGRVEGADPVDPTLAGDGCPPGRGCVVADRGDGSEAGDGNSPHRVSLDTVLQTEVTNREGNREVPPKRLGVLGYESAAFGKESDDS